MDIMTIFIKSQNLNSTFYFKYDTTEIQLYIKRNSKASNAPKQNPKVSEAWQIQYYQIRLQKIMIKVDSKKEKMLLLSVEPIT